MKNLVILLTLVAFAMAAPFALAAEKTAKPVPVAKAEAKVKCCVEGVCKEDMTAKECKAEKGKVVKDCKKCKPKKAETKKPEPRMDSPETPK
jgi:hypothetical protein